ncbi:tautomerase family protein [Companilactobacillus versmoldensis]|uniref:4-oxalocrotonate tautomerase n=1 Tax=Companilactobacillus versmoldensis DSM 14857 = KCTC 3814 TaxID=1423815 RepID=A0A0R1SCM0_9LACO|nr:tautomerase family protein [Companilactobacillus versmoldensis]KRL66832.1 4-oxalocrotonate tautomerase [Companilactobacillus versmoldensis DSM 14857 = KCTC 3814]
MPMMKIDMYKGRNKEQIKQILDIAYQVSTKEFHLLPHDRYQIVTQHDPEEMVIDDVGLGFNRSQDFLMFSLTSSPRTREEKENFYKNLVAELHDQTGISPEDVMINITPNTKEDWSFGNGEAQFLNGKL